MSGTFTGCASGLRARCRNPSPRAAARGKRSSRCSIGASALKWASASSLRAFSHARGRPAAPCLTASRFWTPSVASSGATIPRRRADGLILSIQLVPYVESQHLLLSRDITQFFRIETVRRDFVANVSHELRTPLTVLVGFLETIKELKLDPERSRDYLNLMAEQSRRMQRIIDDLLTLSTLESAPEPPQEERVEVASLLARVRGEAEGLSAGRHRVLLDAEPGFDLLGSEPEIASAFGNLASNAIRYTPSGGEVRLLWRASQKGAEFAVEDTGVGIEAEHIPRLTERFYRVDRGRSRETGGTGLGLAIVKHALARHQATLEIESTPGEGSRFTAKFPARRVVPQRADLSQASPSLGLEAAVLPSKEQSQSKP